MGRKSRGQALVIFAVLLPVLVLFFLFALGLAAVLDARAHAADALSVATRAGARQIEYAGCGDGGPQFDERVINETKEVFQKALESRTSGLASTPEEIAWQRTDVVVGYGSTERPWPSPFVEGRQHDHPTVAARASLPVRVWLFEITVPVVSETEVR